VARRLSSHGVPSQHGEVAIVTGRADTVA